MIHGLKTHSSSQTLYHVCNLRVVAERRFQSVAQRQQESPGTDEDALPTERRARHARRDTHLLFRNSWVAAAG